MKEKKTKIVMTVGPASEDEKTLAGLFRAGVDVVRFNFSHGDLAEHSRRIKAVRRAAAKAGKPVALLQDLGGPKIRLGDFEEGEITLRRGQTFALFTRKRLGNEEGVFINYPRLAREVKPGQEILLDDGGKKLVVSEVKRDRVLTRVLLGGKIRSRRGVNLPGANLSVSSLTAKDRKDLLLGIKEKVDFVALSFVRSPGDIAALRKILRRGGSTALIVAKIETKEAIENLDKIIAAADAVMVARGDLAVEVPPQEVPHLQKKIVRLSRLAAKPVIVATQMLESMISAPTPTRAEVADVANAVLDGTDAIMLSAETAIGRYPRWAVEIMREVAARTEKEEVAFAGPDASSAVPDAVIDGAMTVARNLRVKAIVVLTESGFAARKVSSHRPREAIVALTPSPAVVGQLALSYGCRPFLIKGFNCLDEAIKTSAEKVLSARLARKGERILVLSGVPFGRSGSTNMLTVVTL